MPKKAKRKVSYNYLFLQSDECNLEVMNNLTKLLEFIMYREKVDKKYELSKDRFAFLESFETEMVEDGMVAHLLFKSAKHSYRAPLLDKNTVEVRDNPKRLEEGEQMKTHALIKFKNGDAIFLLESGLNVMTCLNVTQYLNNFIPIYNSQLENDSDDIIIGKFTSDMIASDNFREMLDDMQRAIVAEVYTDNVILGGDMLNYSEPTEQLKEDVMLTIGAKRGLDIKNFVYKIADKFNSGHPEIKRIRVRGKMNNGTEGIIDTGFLGKKEFVDAQQNDDTGEYNTEYMFSQLSILAKDY